MKRAILFAVVLGLAVVLGNGADKKDEAHLVGNTDTQFKRFLKEKKAYIERLIADHKLKPSQGIPDLIRAVEMDNPSVVANARFREWQASTNNNPLLPALLEVYGGYEQYKLWEPHFRKTYIDGIVGSIPKGSIYFGGTDAGRFLITAGCDSHEKGDPFFTITQNALADRYYLNYVQGIYGKKIPIPSSADYAAAYQHATRTPGISQESAVWELNRYLAKIIFERNPKHRFFVEESLWIPWMGPHLTPHGFIMELHRKPVEEFTEEMIAKDQRFWAAHVKGWLGNWLTADTGFAEVIDWVERVHVKNDLKQFKGEDALLRIQLTGVFATRQWAANACGSSQPAREFSKLRLGQAQIYERRVAHCRMQLSAKKKPAPDRLQQLQAELKRCKRASALAFAQAYAICPGSSETLFELVNHLLANGEIVVARRLWKTQQALAKARQGDLSTMKYILPNGMFPQFLNRGDLRGFRASVGFAEDIQPGFGKRPEIQLTLRIDRMLKEGQLDAVAVLLKASKTLAESNKIRHQMIHIPQLLKGHYMAGGPRANQVLSLIEKWFPQRATSDAVLAAALLPKWEAEHLKDPQDTSRLNRLITACVNLGETKKANAIAERLLVESKANKAMLSPALTAYQLLNNYEGMEKILLQIVILVPENESVWIQLARVQNYLGKTKACLESLQKALAAKQKGATDIRKLILSEPSFKNLHQNPKFKELFPPKKDK